MSSGANWQSFFVEAGIPRKVAVQYSQLFVQQRIKETMLDDIDKTTLIDLGITTIGDQIAILRYIRERKRADIEETPTQRSVGINEQKRERIVAVSESAKVGRSRPAPDRDDIYHVRMPAGTTPKTRAIMAKHNLLRSAGLLKRGFTGVRQSGKEVRSISNRNYLKKILIASPEVSSTTSNVYERLGVQGLVSDSMPKPTSVRNLSGKGSVRYHSENPATQEAGVMRRTVEGTRKVNVKEPVFRVRISDRANPSTSRIQRGGITGFRGTLPKRNWLSLRGGSSGSIRKKPPVTTRISRGVRVPFSKTRRGIVSQSSVFERLG